MLHHIMANQMRQELVAHIIRSNTKISIMLDESTSLFSVTCLIVYIRCIVGEHAENYFLDLKDTL